MNDDEHTRVDKLETEFAELQAGVAAQNTALKAIQELIADLGTRLPVQPPVIPPPVPDTNTTHTPLQNHAPSLKPATPSDFDGTREKGRAFLNSCQLYMSLVPRQFPTDSVKIGWAISFMKSGRASLFADRVLRHHAKHGSMPYADWAAFRMEFVESFCPRNEAQHALTRLETDEYHQGQRSVDEYTDEFKDLVELAGYTDGLVIVIKYRRGLSPTIQSQVATMTTGRPADTEPRQWFAAASLCDENHRTNAAFVATKQPHSARTTSSTPRAPQPAFRSLCC